MKGMTATSLFVTVLLLLHSVGVVRAEKYKPLKKPLFKGLYCEIGFGQRGAAFDERQSWVRMCHDTTYCWRGRTDTTQVETMRRMFVFPWQGHYEEYYVMGCGGYVGSPLADPWRPWPVDREFIPPVTMVVYQNETVVLPGDSVSLTLDYTCNSNHCSAAVGSHTLSVLAAGVAVLVSFVLM